MRPVVESSKSSGYGLAVGPSLDLQVVTFIATNIIFNHDRDDKLED